VNTLSPRVAILLPVYNREELLPSTIQAICVQSFTDYVIVAVDDASSDGSWSILQAAAKQNPDRWIIERNKKNLGGAANMNRCLAIQRKGAPQAAYIVKVDSDDLISPELIESGVRVLDNDPDAVLCHFRTLKVGEEGIEDLANCDFGEKLARYGWSRFASHRMTPVEALRMFIRFDNFISSSSGAVIRVRSLESLTWPWYNEGFRLEDYDLWSRLAQRGAVHYVADVNVSLRRDGMSRLEGTPLCRRRAEARRIALRSYFRNLPLLGPALVLKLLPIVCYKAWLLLTSPSYRSESR
jgi:glycosyltransferase involved in cell wall biosynthesis